MTLWDFKKEFDRTYIKYLLEEVEVEPLEDFDVITLTRGAIYFVRGESVKVPRWLAILLAKAGKVRLLEDETADPKKLIAKVISLSYPPLGEEKIDKDIYLKFYDAIKAERNPDDKERMLKHLTTLIEARKPKVLSKALSEKEHDVLWEDVLFRAVKKCLKDWLKALLEDLK